jgi:hypothetical protein
MAVAAKRGQTGWFLWIMVLTLWAIIPYVILNPKPQIAKEANSPISSSYRTSSDQIFRPSFSRTPKNIGCLVIIIMVVCAGLYGTIANALHFGQPNIVSFTVDDDHVSVGTTVKLKVTFDGDLNRIFNPPGYEIDVDVSVSGGLCNYSAYTTCPYTCRSFDPHPCVFTDSYDHPVTVQYKAYVGEVTATVANNSPDQQVGDAMTLTVIWT